jgi:CDP-diacylglycerol--glycerol-3-phosphate 3-phosphatidyltransferase
MGHSCGNDHSRLGRRNREPPTCLTGTTLTFLKPRLKRLLYPVAALLARTGVTANRVTLASLAGSIAVGSVLCSFPDRPALFGILPVWVLVRTACASLDGTLADEFGLKSRLGGVLNETGDILSEIALFLPLMFISSCTVAEGSIVIALVVLSELAGLAALAFGDQRRVEGPLGKADRSIVLSMGRRCRLPGDFARPDLACVVGSLCWSCNHRLESIVHGRQARGPCQPALPEPSIEPSVEVGVDEKDSLAITPLRLRDSPAPASARRPNDSQR